MLKFKYLNNSLSIWELSVFMTFMGYDHIPAHFGLCKRWLSVSRSLYESVIFPSLPTLTDAQCIASTYAQGTVSTCG